MAFNSGRKDRIVVACVTFEVPMVVDPIVFYEATRVHLIHFVRDSSDPRCNVYREFYDEVCASIKEKRDVEICEHISKVYDYTAMLKTILSIVADEKSRTKGQLELFVNISSGTSEYSAAAMLACMQDRELIPFTVRTRQYSLSEDDIKRLCYSDGRPVGLTSRTFNPIKVSTFDALAPDMTLVSCLAIIAEINNSRTNVRFMDYIERLKSEDLWNHEPDAKRSRTDLEQKERVYFKRTFIEPMVEKGWLVEDPRRKNKYLLTDDGEAILEIYG